MGKWNSLLCTGCSPTPQLKTHHKTAEDAPQDSWRRNTRQLKTQHQTAETQHKTTETQHKSKQKTQHKSKLKTRHKSKQHSYRHWTQEGQHKGSHDRRRWSRSLHSTQEVWWSTRQPPAQSYSTQVNLELVDCPSRWI